MQFLVKVFLSALIIAGVPELGRRYSLFAAILASLPLTSTLAIAWLYYDARDPGRSSSSRKRSFGWWPSLVFFLVLSLLKGRMSFLPALLIASVVMVAAYWLSTLLHGQFGIKL